MTDNTADGVPDDRPEDRPGDGLGGAGAAAGGTADAPMGDEEAQAILDEEARRTATLWRALDLDGDGVLSAAEIEAAPSSLLALDRNGDGRLTEDEYGGPFRYLGGGRTSAVLRVLDQDADGVIGPDDIAAAPSRLRRLDRLGRGHLVEADDRPPQNPVRAGWFDGPAAWLDNQDTLRSYRMDDSGTVPPGADRRQSDGYLLVYEHGNANDVQLAGDLYLMASDGTRVHHWPRLHHPSETVTPWLRDDGLLLRTGGSGDWIDNLAFPVGAHGILSLVEPDGTIVWEYRLFEPGRRAMHHDYEPLPNGNILVTVYDGRTFEEAIEMGWVDQSRNGLLRPPDLLRHWTESILELEPDLETGDTRIVWEWHSADHLVQNVDPAAPYYGDVGPGCRRIDLNYARYRNYRFNMGQIMHVNTVSYDAGHDQIMLSSAMHGELWVIDHSIGTAEASGPAGDLLYRCGNLQAYGAGDDKVFDWQHDVHWLPAGVPGAGEVLVFNNGGRNCRPEFPNPHPKRIQFGGPTGNGAYSELLQLRLPVDDDGRWTWTDGDPLNGAEITWTYNAEGDRDLFSPFMSGARRRSNGNTVMAQGYDKRVREVTPDGEVVLDVRLGGPGRVFRVVPVAAEHPGLRRLGL